MKDKRIIETDNFGRDYPNESFLKLPLLDSESAEIIADLINENAGPENDRIWLVVERDYKLQPGFEP